jgi:hypothetical protein
MKGQQKCRQIARCGPHRTEVIDLMRKADQGLYRRGTWPHSRAEQDIGPAQVSQAGPGTSRFWDIGGPLHLREVPDWPFDGRGMSSGSMEVVDHRMHKRFVRRS